MSFYLAYFMMVLMNTVAVERIMRVFFEKRRTSLTLTAFSYILFIALPGATFLIFNIPILNLLATILAIAIITLNYKSSILKRLVASLCVLFFLVMIDILSFIIFDVRVELFIGPEHVRNIQFICSGLISLLLALLLQRFTSLKKEHKATLLYWISAMFIPAASLFLLIFVWTVFHFTQITVFIFVSVIAVMNILHIYFLDTILKSHEEKLKSVLHEQEKEYYFSQLQLMHQSTEQIRTIRHDIKLHLATAMDYNANNKTDELANYLKSLLGDIEKSEVYSNTGNIAVDSIINFKLKDVVENNIKTDIDVFIPKDLKMEVVDIVAILGNLLDNALEGVEKVEDKRIKLTITSNKGNVLMKIENTFDGVVQYADDKGNAQKTILTRKDGDEHGYGLKNIQKSVEKYNGHMEIGHEDGVFSVGVLLYV